MLKGKISLQAFAGAISQSISRANEMLQKNHREAILRVINDERGMLMPPPTPLMIQNVKIKFRADVSRSEFERDSSDLLIDLSKPDGNFSGELEFVPFSSDMLRSAKGGDGHRWRHSERPVKPEFPQPNHGSRPMQQGAQPFIQDPDEDYAQQEDDEQAYYPQDEMEQETYTEPETPYDYSSANRGSRHSGRNSRRPSRPAYSQSHHTGRPPRHGSRYMTQDTESEYAQQEGEEQTYYSQDDMQGAYDESETTRD